MNNILKITIKNQLKASRMSFLCVAGLPAVVIYLNYYYNTNFDRGRIIILVSFLIFACLRAIFLHTEYYLINKGEEYELKGDHIIYRKEDEEVIYKKEDIKKIAVFMSYNRYHNRGYVNAAEIYHFARVFLKSGEILHLTSLLTPNVDKTLKTYLSEIPYRKERRFFPSTLW